MRKILEQEYFEKGGEALALDLLGKYLVRRKGIKEIALIINEVELYDGYEDPSSHAFNGNKGRASVMFGPPGHWYVYLCYGMYEMLNLVIGENNYPAAILIRGGETKDCNFDGPGKLTKFLDIGRNFNSKPAVKSTGLWLEDRGVVIMKNSIIAAPRVGIGATGEWAAKPYRFLIKKK